MTNGPATATFDPTPSLQRVGAVQIGIAPVAPKSATVVGVPVAARGDVGETLGVDRKQLKAAGFDADGRLDARRARRRRWHSRGGRHR